MRNRTLYLHIGHGKTGTSWLQAGFWLNQDTLAKHGIFYPSTPNQEHLRPASITSGNAQGFATSTETYRSRLSALSQLAPGCSMLLSSEWTFVELLSWTKNPGCIARQIYQIAREIGFSRVEVLLFIRNPIGLAASRWQQQCKRAGETRSIDEWMKDEDHCDSPRQVANFLDRFDSHEAVGLTILNYGRVAKDLLGVAESWMGLPAGTLQPPPVTQVNRSMTRAELDLQRALNHVLGSSGYFLSDALCEQLPDIKADTILPSYEAQLAMWDRDREHIDFVNRRIPSEHAYAFDAEKPGNCPQASLTPEQTEVIATSFGKVYLDVQHRATTLKEHAANLQRHTENLHQHVDNLQRQLDEQSVRVTGLEQAGARLRSDLNLRDHEILSLKAELAAMAAIEGQRDTALLEAYKAKRRPWKYLGECLRMRLDDLAQVRFLSR